MQTFESPPRFKKQNQEVLGIGKLHSQTGSSGGPGVGWHFDGGLWNPEDMRESVQPLEEVTSES